MYLAFFLTRRVSTHDVLAHKLVVQICEEIYHYPKIWVSYDLTQQEKDDLDRNQNNSRSYAYIAAAFAGILVMGLFMGLLVLLLAFMDWLEDHCSILHKLITRTAHFVVTSPSRSYRMFRRQLALRAFLVITIFYGHYIAGVSYAVFRLYQYRHRIEKFNQQEFQGNQWSFGQITAMVAYVPVGYDVLISVIGQSQFFIHRIVF